MDLTSQMKILPKAVSFRPKPIPTPLSFRPKPIPTPLSFRPKRSGAEKSIKKAYHFDMLFYSHSFIATICFPSHTNTFFAFVIDLLT